MCVIVLGMFEVCSARPYDGASVISDGDRPFRRCNSRTDKTLWFVAVFWFWRMRGVCAHAIFSGAFSSVWCSLKHESVDRLLPVACGGCMHFLKFCVCVALCVLALCRVGLNILQVVRNSLLKHKLPRILHFHGISFSCAVQHIIADSHGHAHYFRLNS